MAKNTKKKWNETTSSGEILAYGNFESTRPILFIENSKGFFNEEEDISIKCAGTNNSYVSKDEFLFGNKCNNCIHKTNQYALWDNQISNGNLMHPIHSRYSTTTLIVPKGCPHYISQDVDNNTTKENGYNIVFSRSRKTTKLIPHSWKIVKQKNKLTLSIQYFTLFVNIEKKQEIKKFFYQHITLDTVKGTTFISNIHNDKQVFAPINQPNPIETITYTGQTTQSKTIAPKHLIQNEVSFVEPMKKLYEALKQELVLQGYEPVTPYLEEVHSWSNKTPSYETDESKLLYMIAKTNRFPLMPCYPLLDRNVPLQIRRDFDALPKDVTPQTLAQHLGIHNNLLAKALEQNPSQSMLTAVLPSFGCNNEQSIAYAINHKLGDIFAKNSDIISDDGNLIENFYDLLAYLMPAIISPNGWEDTIQDIIHNQKEFSETITITKELIKTKHVMEPYGSMGRLIDFNHSVNPYDMPYSREDSDEYRNNMVHVLEKFHSGINKIMQLFDTLRSDEQEFKNSIFFGQYNQTIQNLHTKYHFEENISEDEETSYRNRFYTISSTQNNKKHVENLRIKTVYSLDRRVWNKPTAKKYTDAIMLLHNQFDVALNKDENSKEFKELEKTVKTIKKYQEKLQSAWKVETTIIIKADNHRFYGVTEDMKTPIYKWTEKHNITFRKIFEGRDLKTYNSNAHKNHLRRVKRKKAKK